jgi:hypothetical protein
MLGPRAAGSQFGGIKSIIDKVELISRNVAAVTRLLIKFVRLLLQAWNGRLSRQTRETFRVRMRPDVEAMSNFRTRQFGRVFRIDVSEVTLLSYQFLATFACGQKRTLKSLDFGDHEGPLSTRSGQRWP